MTRTRLAALPIGVLLTLTAAPVIFLLAHLSGDGLGVEWSSFPGTLGFAVGGAAVATVAGGTIGILLGTREFTGRRTLLALAVVPIAAPPAFWWLGATRLTSAWGNVQGVGAGAIIGGLALSPVTLLLVIAALRELPSNVYQAARVALPPAIRVVHVLLPLLRSALFGGFIFTLILLLGESELPFLLGFRTVMTDIVTRFSQTFEVGRTVPLVVPLLIAILALGLVAAPPLMRTVLTSSRGAHGVVRAPGSVLVTLCAAAPAIGLLLAFGGFAWSVIATARDGWPRVPVDTFTVLISIGEPVASAWIAVIVTLITAYPARRTRAMPTFLWIGLLLFCVPAAIYAIGWLSIGQALGGFGILPAVAHISRAVALSTLAFAVGYTRLPTSVEHAAALVSVSPFRRAVVFVLPLIVGSLIAVSALIAALTYADRDVASLLLPPGASRLTLNLYLASANAPSSTIGALAIVVLVGAALTVAVAAAGPALVWGRRG